jgi:CTP:molybdopterin cytidylyltransferase MocA
MLRHLVDSCAEAFDQIVVVVGPETTATAAAAAPWPHVIQHERLGTAHAALQAAEHFGEGEVAVLYADNPLITPETLKRLLARRAAGTPASRCSPCGRRTRPATAASSPMATTSRASSNTRTRPPRSAPSAYATPACSAPMRRACSPGCAR